MLPPAPITEQLYVRALSILNDGRDHLPDAREWAIGVVADAVDAVQQRAHHFDLRQPNYGDALRWW